MIRVKIKRFVQSGCRRRLLALQQLAARSTSTDDGSFGFQIQALIRSLLYFQLVPSIGMVLVLRLDTRGQAWW